MPETRTDRWEAGSIRTLRKDLGLTQEEMAERMGVRRPTISDWETRKQRPSPMACRLLDMLQTNHGEE